MNDAAEVAAVIGLALRVAYGDNADPYEDDPLHYGVAFADGSMVDVLVVSRGL